jgi:hypothetical protein
MGGLWGVMCARSVDEITSKYPEVNVVSERPAWMTEQHWSEFFDDPYDIDEAPKGPLLAVRRASLSQKKVCAPLRLIWQPSEMLTS